MKGSRFTEEQIIGILKEWEAGLGTGDLCRKHGISDKTLYNWKAKYSGMVANDLKKLKALEEENRKLKTIVAEQVLDIQCLKSVISKNY
jgi:putative transposase